MLYDFLAPLLAPVPLIRANQDGPSPKRPFATYRVARATDPRHAVTTTPDDDGNNLVRSHRTLGVEVQIYGAGSEAASDRLALALRAETVAQAAERLGFALATVAAAQHVPALLDNARWEERGVVEFTGYALAEIADTPGLIERAEVTQSDPEGVPVPSGSGHAVTVSGPTPARGGRVEFVQPVPSAMWTIRHGLSRRPEIEVYAADGSVVEGERAFPDDATVVLTFSRPIAGAAYLT